MPDYVSKLRSNSMYGMLDVHRKYHMPRDITDVDDDRVRMLQSYWTGMLTYLYTAQAKAKVQAGGYETLLTDHRQGRFVKITQNLRSRQTREYINARVASGKRYIELLVKLTKAKADVEMLAAFIISSEKIIFTASREQSWRENELKARFGRQGQGT